jgi:FkbM family methyltransferase
MSVATLGRRGFQWLRRPLAHKIISVRTHVTGVIASALLPAVAACVNRLDRNTRYREHYFRTRTTDTSYLMAHLQDTKETFVVIGYDTAVSRNLYVHGTSDFALLQTAVDALGATFTLEMLVDIGANIGTICVPAVKRGLAKRAIAIEPEARNYRMLMANIFLNGVEDRIQVHNQALGDSDDQTVLLELSPNNAGDHRIRVESTDGLLGEKNRVLTTVRSDTLERVVGDIDASRTLLFMDAQGSEGLILAGARHAVAAQVPVVTEVWPYGLKRAGCYHQLREVVSRYQHFYDLSEASPVAHPSGEIDNLLAGVEAAAKIDPAAHANILLR